MEAAAVSSDGESAGELLLRAAALVPWTRYALAALALAAAILSSTYSGTSSAAYAAAASRSPSTLSLRCTTGSPPSAARSTAGGNMGSYHEAAAVRVRASTGENCS